MTTLSGTFTLTSSIEDTLRELEGGGKLTRSRMDMALTGGLTGTGEWESVMCYRKDGTADYVGMERIEGRVDGRAGSFVLETTGSYDGTEARTTWRVVPGSGTGQLASLRGQGSAAAPHGPDGTYQLEVAFD